jgi:hypothetical protein
MRQHRWNFAVIQALIMTLFAACAKDKFKDILPQPASAVNASSSIRLFNFLNVNADISVNNIPLTSYGSSQATQIGLSIFPAGYWPNSDGGSPFTISSALLDKQGRAHVIIAPQAFGSGYLNTVNFPKIDTVLQNDPLHPNDYYALFDGTLKIVSRNTAAPAQPDHFKIRILNLMKDTDQVGYKGPVTLTYADGTVVNSVTSGIFPADTLGHSGASGYIELPLGAYQFKLFMSQPDGKPDYTKQLAELPARPFFNGLNQTPAAQQPQESIFPKIRTFKAGATYSIVITKAVVDQSYTDPGGNNLHWYESVNAYRIVTEQSAGANTTYACMDAVNALRLPGVGIQVDGYPLATNLAFGQYAGHKVYVWGSHHVQAVDQQGQVLAEKDIMTYPNDYLTAWTYLNPEGKPDIVFSSMDMTSTLYQTNQFGNAVTNGGSSYISVPDDGTNGSIRVATSDYTWSSRFLNLSEDIPYTTFGNDNIQAAGYGYAGSDLLFTAAKGDISDSANFATATINLGRGVTNAQNPFVLYSIPSNGFWDGHGNSMAPSDRPSTVGPHILVFQSDPGPPAIVPGQLLAHVPLLSFNSFVANPALYSSPLLTPAVEPGFYSVALIGNVAQAAAGQARLIYVKHNQ